MYKNISRIFLIILVLLTTGTIQGQVLKEITGKYLKYCSEVPREEVYIHTDRNDYIAGEELWFSAYLMDRQSNKPSVINNIIYVEILNSMNQPVGQKRIMAERGFGPGEITLPDTLTTGSYLIRAYTDWMRNFLPANCFTKKINIYNALNPAGGITAGTQKPIVTNTGRTYASSQFSFKVENHNGSDLVLSISSSDSYRSVNSSLCYIFIETHGIINYSAAVNITGNSTSYSLPGKNLTGGINHITFFDSKGKPVAEKYIYTPVKETDQLKIAVPDSCRKREKITMQMDVSSVITGFADSSGISVSIAQVSREVQDDLTDYMIFGSEFGMLPDNIAGKHPGTVSRELLDEFLSTARSSWIDWDLILSEQYALTGSLKSKESHFLSGRLFNRNTRLPIAGKLLFLSTPGKHASFQYAVTDSKGIFRFVVPVSEQDQDLIIQPEENDKNNSIELLSSFADNFPENGLTMPAPDKDIPSYVARWSANYQVNRIYATGFSVPVAASSEKQAEKIRFYGKPDIELKMDDYIKLPVMQEVFFELMPGVSLKSRKNNYEVTIIDPVDNKVQKRPPVLFIDGVIVSDVNIIASLDPEIVEMIDVIKEKYFVGNYIFYGLINIITRAGDFSCAPLPEQALRINYRAIDPEMTFVEPDFTSAGKNMENIPDFRNTLYWNPYIRPGKDGKCSVTFMASDLAGDYEIKVQGLSSDGKPVSGRKILRIY